MRNQKTQLIVTRKCNDWFVDEYVPFSLKKEQKKTQPTRIESVKHIQPEMTVNQRVRKDTRHY